MRQMLAKAQNRCCTLAVGHGAGKGLCVNFSLPAQNTRHLYAGNGQRVEADYPYHSGDAGDARHQSMNFAVQECDLPIARGARFDDRVTGKTEHLRTTRQRYPYGYRSAEMNSCVRHMWHYRVI